MKTIVDLSQEIYTGMPVYPGHLETKVWDFHHHDETVADFDDGFSYASKALTLNEHGPTHVDAPAHFNDSPDATTIDQMDLQLFQGDGIVLDVSAVPDGGPITDEVLEQAAAASAVSMRADLIVLLHTGHFLRNGGTERYSSGYAGLDASGCKWLRARQPRVFGTDTPGPDLTSNRNRPAHMLGRETGLTHYENLCNLEQIADRPFWFIGMPLKIRQGTGGPTRAVAFLD